jgi:RND superfamily putative drug exporter
MTVVFFAFTFTTDRTIKMIGLGMAAAVVADALIVRTVLVPAVMHMLGKANWRIPAALDRILPRLDLEAGGEASGAGKASGASGASETTEAEPSEVRGT